MMPMAVLAATTRRKTSSPKDPTAMRKAAMTKNMMLKKEKRFSRTMRLTDLVGESGGVLTSPARSRLRTCSQVSPLLEWERS